MTEENSQSKKLYVAGELFSMKHLYGNAAFASTLHQLSEGQLLGVLPQAFEQRGTDPVAIRDEDLRALLACDGGIFHFDGPELDSGTLVEFLYTKFADFPAVLLRTDFRSAGDNSLVPWNLMVAGFPRTKVVSLNAMELYQVALHKKSFNPEDPTDVARASMEASQEALERIVQDCIGAYQEAAQEPQRIDPSEREVIFRWLRRSAGPTLEKALSDSELQQLIERE